MKKQAKEGISMKKVTAALLILAVCLVPGCASVNPEIQDHAATEYYESQHETYEMQGEYEDKIDELQEEVNGLYGELDDLKGALEWKGIDSDKLLEDYYEYLDSQ